MRTAARSASDPIQWPFQAMRAPTSARSSGRSRMTSSLALMAPRTRTPDFKGPHLLCLEIHHRHDQAAEQLLFPVVRHLRGGPARAVRPEVNGQLVGRFTRFRKIVRSCDPAHTHLYLFEFGPGDRRHRCCLAAFNQYSRPAWARAVFSARSSRTSAHPEAASQTQTGRG